MIPGYLLVRQLGLLDTLWALMIPGAISAFNFFVMRAFFLQIPASLIESARIDGCGETRILAQIVLPLSKPSLATVGIFYAVTHWNSYMSALMYINNRALLPLQVKLRDLVLGGDMSVQSSDSVMSSMLSLVSPAGLKMATIVVATVPILIIYPMVQKYFIKGTMIGSIKE